MFRKGEHNDDSRKARRIAHLIAGFNQGILKPAEKEELDEWVGASDRNFRIFQEMANNETRANFAAWIKNKKNIQGGASKSRLFPVRFVRCLQYSIAALLALVLFLSIFLVFELKSKSNLREIADIDWRKLYNTQLVAVREPKYVVNDNNTKVKGLDDENINKDPVRATLVRQDQNNLELNNTMFSSITIPANAAYDLVLPDGTKVHLNENSSIRYPNIFDSYERRVSVTGEAYFEVAGQSSAPFIVEVNDLFTLKTWPWYTRFLVRAHKDKAMPIVTLFDGIVNLQEKNIEISNQATIRHNPSVEIVIGGYSDTTLYGAVNRLEFADYDFLKIIGEFTMYNGYTVFFRSTEINRENKYYGSLSKTTPLMDLLDVFNKMESINYKVQDRIITLMTKKASL